MERSQPILVRAADAAAPPGPQTPGMDRRQLFDHDDRWAGWVRTTPGVASGWHHHGDRDSYIYVTRGSIRIEFGPAGREHVVASEGDFVYNPSRIVHREITGPGEAAEAFVMRIGPGPLNFNVDGPDATDDGD